MGIEELTECLIAPATQVALIIGVAEVIKRAGCKTKYIPLIDLALGLVSGVFVFGMLCGYGIGYGAITGIALGLSACGLFSGIKNLNQKE